MNILWKILLDIVLSIVRPLVEWVVMEIVNHLLDLAKRLVRESKKSQADSAKQEAKAAQDRAESARTAPNATEADVVARTSEAEVKTAIAADREMRVKEVSESFEQVAEKIRHAAGEALRNVNFEIRRNKLIVVVSDKQKSLPLPSAFPKLLPGPTEKKSAKPKSSKAHKAI